LECYLNLANALEKDGQKEESDRISMKCLDEFDKKDAELRIKNN
jgi:hypothetical protein